MIASEPFIAAYGLDMLLNAIIIDIGAATVDLCRIHGTLPTDEDQITTFKAGDYIDQVFLDCIKQKYKHANFTLKMIKRFKEENVFICKQGERIFIDISDRGKKAIHDVTDDLREACRSVVPEIVEGISKLVAACEPGSQEQLKQNVILSGGGSQIAGLRKEIEDYLKETLGCGKVTRGQNHYMPEQAGP